MEDQSWLEPEKVDEGLEATTTATASSSCLDWCLCNIWKPACRSLRHDIVVDDAPFIPKTMSSEYQTERIEQSWKRELDPNFRATRCCCRSKPSLFRAVNVISGHYIVFGMLCGIMQGIAQGLFRPFLIMFLVDELSKSDPDLWHMVAFVVGLSLANIVEGFSGSMAMRCIKDRAFTAYLMSLANLVQRKGMRIKDGLSSMTPAGIVGNDVIRMGHMLTYMSWCAYAFTCLIAGIVTLVLTLGWVSVVALIACAAIVATNLTLGRLSRKHARDALTAADTRLGIMTEIVQGIKAIKLCAWEGKFLEHITAARTAETIPIGKQRCLGEASTQVGRSAPNLMAMVCFVVLALVEPNADMLRPGPVFAAVNVFLALRAPLIMIPETIMHVQHIAVSFARITHFLLLPESAPPPKPPPGSLRIRKGDVVIGIPANASFNWRSLDPHYDYGHKSDDKSVEASDDKKDKAARELSPTTDFKPKSSVVGTSDSKEGEDTTAVLLATAEKRQQREFRLALADVDITIPHGQRVAVVGSVGSGKSSLLMAILGHLDRTDPGATEDARYIVDNVHTGYVPQKPFIVRGSIRTNIHMGRGVGVPGHETRFATAVKGAGLEPDLNQIQGGVEAEIGSDTLSGGQRQRVGVARALYSRTQLLVLDDPLSAVDGASATTILNALMQRPDTTVIMAMNQVRMVHQFDRVLIIDEGNVVADLPPTGVQAAMDRGELGTLSPAGRELMEQLAEAATAASRDGGVLNDSISIEDAGSAEHPSDPPEGESDEPTSVRTLTIKERRDTGNNTFRTYCEYVKGMGAGYFGPSLFFCISAYGCMAFADRWLAIWMDWVETQVSDHQSMDANGTAPPLDMDHRLYVSVYGIAAACFMLFLLIESAMFMLGGIRSSRSLHYRCLNTLMHAPVSWFDSNPKGRIISRFSADISVVDIFLPRYLDWAAQFLMTIIALCLVVAMVLPWMVPVLAFALCVFIMQLAMACRITRDAKRDANNAMSPVQSTLAEIEQGRLLIRTMRLEPFFTTRFMSVMDKLQRSTYFSVSIHTWQSVVSNLVALGLSVPAAVIILATDLNNRQGVDETNMNSTNSTSLSSGDTALALTYAFTIPFFMLALSMLGGMSVVMLTSLERLLQYADTKSIPQEPAWRTTNDPKPEAWPSKGCIVFEDASLVYKPGLAPALRHVSLRFEGGERIGIVGPSGAGKSSLVVLLSRLLDPSTGRVLIDGLDTRDLGLLTLRQAMAIIPQTPLLLGASVRKNLDPFDEHSTEALQDALHAVGLSTGLLDDNHQKAEKGDKAKHAADKGGAEDTALATSLSAGEKQMLNLARAALLPNIRILVCDEPTSNIDMATDRRLQQVIQKLFSNCTIVTIAHRLDTVVDCDKIAVMNAGAVAEFGPPLELLQQEGSMLRRMGIDSGGLENLIHLAQRARSGDKTSVFRSDPRVDQQIADDEDMAADVHDV